MRATLVTLNFPLSVGGGGGSMCVRACLRGMRAPRVTLYLFSSVGGGGGTAREEPAAHRVSGQQRRDVSRAGAQEPVPLPRSVLTQYSLSTQSVELVTHADCKTLLVSNGKAF